MSLTAEQILSAKEWNKAVETNVQNAIGAKLDGAFLAANYPPGFNYAVKQQYYNADSLSTLNSLVITADDIPALGGSFASLYKNVIGNLEYGFSTADLKKMKEEETKHGAMYGTIINLYKESGLDDAPDDYPTIMYIMKRIKQETGMDYLHVNFKEFPNLAPLCRNLSEYARLGLFTAKMQNVWDAADNRMNAIIHNITNPSESNGGIKTGNSAYSIGWEKLPETEQLLASLKSGSSVKFSLSAKGFSERNTTVHFENNVKAKIPFNWFFKVNVNQDSYDFSSYTKQESELSISITYTGLTTLGAVPQPLSDNNLKGWFANDILLEAAEKSGQDTTGYKLHGSEFDPGRLFGRNGQLRRLKTFVLSQQPMITLHFSKFDSDKLKKVFSQKTDVDFSLFGGLISGSHRNGYSFSEVTQNEEKQTLDVTIKPDPIGESGSLGKQTAFILGGVAETYGA